jgi:hypothetical protein
MVQGTAFIFKAQPFSQEPAVMAIGTVCPGADHLSIAGTDDDSYSQKFGKTVENAVDIVLENMFYSIAHVYLLSLINEQASYGNIHKAMLLFHQA